MKKENLQTAIEATKAKLHNAEGERAGAMPEELIMIDKKIRGLQIELKYLTESVALLEKEEKPTDELALAKLLVLDLCEQAQNDNVDMNGNDKRLIASDRLTESIEKLELLQDMIKGHTLAFPEMEQFTKDLNCYIEAGTEAVGKATTTIREADEEIEKLTAALEVAKAEGAAEKIIELSELLEDAKKKRQYLEPILDNALHVEVFPVGTISQAWQEVAEIYKYEWRNRLEIVRAAAVLFHNACNELDILTRELKAVRYTLQCIGRENGSHDEIIKGNQIITNGVSREDVQLMAPDENGKLYRILFHNRSELL